MFAAAIYPILLNNYTQKATMDVLRRIPNPHHNQLFTIVASLGFEPRKILLSQFTTKFMNSLRQTPMPVRLTRHMSMDSLTYSAVETVLFILHHAVSVLLTFLDSCKPGCSTDFLYNSYHFCYAPLLR